MDNLTEKAARHKKLAAEYKERKDADHAKHLERHGLTEEEFKHLVATPLPPDQRPPPSLPERVSIKGPYEKVSLGTISPETKAAVMGVRANG